MKNKKFLFPVLLIIFYFLVNLYKLTALPVFADEAIYIRWAQIIIDDWQRYLFYPMNDGKTPLLMWLIVPLQFLFKSQLFAARLVSVFAGLISMIFVGLISFELFKKRKTAYLAMMLYTILPFTFFYHRLAITDALMLSNLTMAYYFSIKAIKTKKNVFYLFLALTFFLALFSKTPAILFLPIFYLNLFIEKNFKWKKFTISFVKLSLSLIIAASLLYSFRFITPLFPQLFSVGGNFLYPIDKALSSDVFAISWSNFKFFGQQLITYLSVVLLIFALPFYKEKRKEQLILVLSAIGFLLPLMIMGKIIYPRYLMPSSLFLIISAAYSLTNKKHRVINLLALIYLFSFSFKFIYPSYFNVNQIPFTRIDQKQFLEEWSSGHGIKETVEYIKELSQENSIAIATEGSFGTLPDGLLLYFHRKDVSNIYIEGIGQPVREIPKEFLDKASDFDQKILVVNSYRLEMDLPEENLVREYVRPNGAPSLQVWKLD